jgi:hypothetical protein
VPMRELGKAQAEKTRKREGLPDRVKESTGGQWVPTHPREARDRAVLEEGLQGGLTWVTCASCPLLRHRCRSS